SRLGQREVTFVHGIEGTAEQGDIHELRLVPSSSFALIGKGCKGVLVQQALVASARDPSRLCLSG
ncbi:MAG TPA: hypothetical protein VKR26_11490, partial [Terriglobales bacterium]|nr:hypothetical protein [Terriglobales bacterium]